jgi:PAS domain S-box-containing protein
MPHIAASAKRCLTFALLCQLLILFPVHTANALEKAVVQLKWLHHFQFAGYYAALEKGFYREAGLDVTLIEGSPNTEVEKEVVSGRADFGVGTSALLLHRAKGEDLVVLGQIFQHSPAIFLAPRKTGIRSIADMAGRRFMYSNQHGDLLAILKKNGIEEHGIVQVPHQGDPRDLISGKAEVMIAYNFNEPFILEQAGEPYLSFSPMTYGIDFYGDNFFSTRKLINERPAFVKAFRTATLRGWQYALTHKSEIAELILAKYSREKNKEWLLFEANQLETIIQPDVVELGYQNPIRWQQINRTFVDLGMIPDGIDPTAIIYSPDNGHDYRLLTATILVSGIIVAILTMIALTFRRLNRKLQTEIADRKLAEDELRKSEKKYASIFDVLPDMVGITRQADGCFIEVNRGFERCTGWTREEAIGRSSLDLGLWDRETRTRAIEIMMKEGHLADFEFELIPKSGARRIGAMFIMPMTLEGIEYNCFMARDITEVRHAEGKLKEYTALLKATIESMPYDFFAIDSSGRYFMQSATSINNWGDVRGKRLEELDVDPGLKRKWLEKNQRALTGETISEETEFTAGSEKFYQLEFLAPIRDDQGEIHGILGFNIDQTPQKTALESLRVSTEKLRMSEAKYRRLYEGMVDGYAMVTMDGLILEYNESFRNMLHYTHEELTHLTYRDITPQRWHAAEKKIITEQVLPRGYSDLYEKELQCKDGSVFPVELRTALISDEDGAPSAMWAIVRDISEREAVQRERLKTQKLESLGVLAGGIAHDFNNILTVIMGNISFAKLDMDESRSGYQPLARAELATLKAAELAKQLLVFAKGGQPIKKAVSLEQILREAIALALSGTNVLGIVDVTTPLNVVEADEGQINQSFHNIILNAVQAMPGGGNLTVHGSNVTLNEANRLGLQPGEYVQLSFSDEGCGISASDQKKIFDPYFTTKAGGSGLGLASTHAIIKRHGGQITVSSSVGKGTTITVYLPSLGTMADDSPLPEETAIEPTAGGSVLVMDDDEMVRDLASITLNRFGYSVTTCKDGNSAVSLYRTAMEQGTPFTLVIMDLTIPGGMGGVEAAREILSFDPEARLVVSSGYSDDPVMANYTEFGFCGAIEKPYRVKDIANILRRAK